MKLDVKYIEGGKGAGMAPFFAVKEGSDRNERTIYSHPILPSNLSLL